MNVMLCLPLKVNNDHSMIIIKHNYYENLNGVFSTSTVGENESTHSVCTSNILYYVV